MRVKCALEEAERRYKNSISLAAEKYRREVLVPLCSRKRLTFWSVNGEFWFVTESGEEIRHESDARRFGLLRVYRTLCNPTEYAHSWFGDFVPFVDRSNWRG